MDLLQTVRKEGSRGGVNFSWDDVKSSQHRENYLGHSVMAPVGRWQTKKDLGWYAKADDAELTKEQREEKERALKREELRKIKQAEEEMMAKALGLPVPDRSNANEEPLGMSHEKQKAANQALKEVLDDDGTVTERPDKGRRHDNAKRDRDERHRSRRHRKRSRSRARSRSLDREREQRTHRSRYRDRSSSSHRHRERKERPPSKDRSYEYSRSRRRDGSSSRFRNDRHNTDRHIHRVSSRSRSPHGGGRRSRYGID